MDGFEPAGGSAVLAELVDSHGEELLADLLFYYRVDLRDLFDEDDPLSPRFVLSLVSFMPQDSAFMASRRGGQQFRGWDAGRYALADVATSLRSFQHLYVSAHIDRRKHPLPKQPDPFPTPEVERTKKAASKPGSFTHMVLTAKAAAARKKKARAAGG